MRNEATSKDAKKENNEANNNNTIKSYKLQEDKKKNRV